MRIGITCYPTYGGSGVVATELGIELAAMGHEVHFISYSQPFRLSGRDNGIFYHEVPVSSYPLFEFPPYDLALASRMAEVAEFNHLDLLHVHYAIPHSVSAMLARQMLAAKGRRLPFVTTLHGTDITLVGLDRSYLPITRFSIQESDGVTSISNYLKAKTLEDFGITRPIEVIPNFVNCDVYMPIKDEWVRSEARKRLALPEEAILMHLSNFRPVKRVVDVVKVFAEVVREIPARLVLVGDGPDRSAAEWLAHDLEIHDKIHFMGKQERVNELLPLADLMLMPSELESFG
ncbi:MAG: N-acetyl-alpha-D-glucosaminyl L-malate synthase BshA, partial [Terracidiphilus sp.]